MPVLANPKHEAFCQLTLQGVRYGWSQADIYKRSGYRAAGHSAEMAASRLMKKDEVRTRIAELSASGARRAEVTAASVLLKLDDVYIGATEAKQFSAAGRAAEAQARIAGVGAADRIEVAGAGGFDPPTVAETLELTAREFGAATAAAIAWTLVDDHDGPMSTDDIARLTLKGMTLDEALERNDRLRKALLRVAGDDAKVVGATPLDAT